MIKTILCAALLGVVLFPVREDQSQITDNSVEPNRFYREFVGLTDEQIREIHEGKALAKILDSPTADQVVVFGSLYVHSTPERYLQFAADLEELRKLPSYLAIQQFSSPPQLTDLKEFTVDSEDFRKLRIASRVIANSNSRPNAWMNSNDRLTGPLPMLPTR